MNDRWNTLNQITMYVSQSTLPWSVQLTSSIRIDPFRELIIYRDSFVCSFVGPWVISMCWFVCQIGDFKQLVCVVLAHLLAVRSAASLLSFLVRIKAEVLRFGNRMDVGNNVSQDVFPCNDKLVIKKQTNPKSFTKWSFLFILVIFEH